MNSGYASIVKKLNEDNALLVTSLGSLGGLLNALND